MKKIMVWAFILIANIAVSQASYAHSEEIVLEEDSLVVYNHDEQTHTVKVSTLIESASHVDYYVLFDKDIKFTVNNIINTRSHMGTEQKQHRTDGNTICVFCVDRTKDINVYLLTIILDGELIASIDVPHDCEIVVFDSIWYNVVK